MKYPDKDQNERSCLAILLNVFFVESGDINLQESLIFVVQNPFSGCRNGFRMLKNL
jgi:hypothetical protein